MGRIYLSKDFEIRKEIMKEYHSAVTGGHSEIKATIKRINFQFWWEGMSKDIREFVINYAILSTDETNKSKESRIVDATTNT